MSFERTELLAKLGGRPDDFAHLDLGNLRRLVARQRHLTPASERETFERRAINLQPSLDRSRFKVWGELPACGGATVEVALLAKGDSFPEESRTESRATRHADALIALCGDSLTGTGTGTDPLTTRVRPDSPTHLHKPPRHQPPQPAAEPLGHTNAPHLLGRSNRVTTSLDSMSHGTGPTDHEGRVIDFGQTAADYEHHRPGFPDAFFDRLVATGWISPGRRALDLGTGTGSLALGFAAHGLDVTGLDIAPELLEIARHRASAQGLNARFVEGRAEATGQNDAAFDLVSAGQCWWWFDADAVLSEAKRILVRGGRLLICNFSYLALPGNVAGRTEDLILQHNPGWPKAGWRGVHPEQVQALDVGGFRQVESFSFTVDVPFTHLGWRGRMRTCNGVGSALDAAQVKAFDSDLAELLATEFPGETELPGELLVPHRLFATSGVTT